MRALCGAIIAAGALIGLGLTALGVGTRYAHNTMLRTDAEGKPIVLHLFELDTPLVFMLVFLTCVAIVGLGIAFLGLAYHHHRRHHEFLREQERHSPAQPRITT
jgi:hypothetical protein